MSIRSNAGSSRRRPDPRRIGAAVGAAVLVAALASLGACDRTRPWPGSQPVAATPGTPAAKAPAGGGAAAPVAGPQKTAEGWKFSYQDPAASTVHLAGTFNSWSTSSDPLQKGEGGVWTLVKELAPGSYQYKFVVNGTQWKEDPNNPNSADDGYGGKNSVIQVP